MVSKIIVLDIGARYGVHPTWKGLEDFKIDFHLVEADQREADRLRTKYCKPRGGNSFFIHGVMLGEDNSEATMLYLSNAAMSGSYERIPSRLFSGTREKQTVITAVEHVPATTIDSYFEDTPVDFLKIDTEGSELQILRGAKNLIHRSVLGVRSEVAFNEVFRGAPIFSEIDMFMRSNGFALLNLDYLGVGDLQHPFVSSSSRYGILNSTDAIWIRNEFLRFPLELASSAQSFEHLLKVCLFSFINCAPDFGLALLGDCRSIIRKFRDRSEFSQLLIGLSHVVEHHFYRLKWLPAQNTSDHSIWFEDVFGRKMRTGTDFMAALDLNP